MAVITIAALKLSITSQEIEQGATLVSTAEKTLEGKMCDRGNPAPLCSGLPLAARKKSDARI